MSAPVTKHTPGPWMVDERDRVSHGAGFEFAGPFVVLAPDDPMMPGAPVVVAEIQDDGEPGVAEADARLIAAAPDLLAALHKIADTRRHDPKCQSGNSARPGAPAFPCDCHVGIARASIAKAEGGAA